MKNIIFVLIVLFGTMGSTFAGNISIIEGTWDRERPDNIKLFRVESGALKEIASTPLTDENKFYFAFAPKQEAFYVIGLNGVAASDHYIFYFKPGDRLNVAVNEDSYTLVGDNTPENKEMVKWHDFIFPLESKSVYFMKHNSTYVDFFPLLEEKLDELNDYKQDYTDNATFNDAFKSLQKYDMLYYAAHFLNTPRSAHPQDEDYPDYYLDMNLADITSSDKLLQYPYGMRILYMYQILSLTVKSNDISPDQKKELAMNPLILMEKLLPEIANEEVKGEFVLLQSKLLKSYEGFLDFQNKYSKYLVTDSQKERFKDIISRVADNTQGQIASDFKFPDTSGKEVALSEFKGKLVYIDVWATWCGPCIREIPALKKLEEEYHGKDVVFMSVSIDVQKDKQKWLDFVKNRELKGVQLFAGDNAKDISVPYKVSGIPRFILIGKDGKLISADAPRPSASEIKALLDASLKE